MAKDDRSGRNRKKPDNNNNCPDCGINHSQKINDLKHRFGKNGLPTLDELETRGKLVDSKYNQFVNTLTIEKILTNGDKFNQSDYICYVVSTIFKLMEKAEKMDELSMVKNSPLGKEVGTTAVFEAQKALVTTFLLEELGEHIFSREL